MKKLKRGVVALLAGEFLVLWKKDSQFKKQVTKKTGWEKAKYIAEKLFSFNKEIFEEGKQVIQSTDMKAEYESLKDKVVESKDSLEGLTKAKRKEIVADLTQQYEGLVEQAKRLEDTLDEKYGWKDKWKELKAMITKLNK